MNDKLFISQAVLDKWIDSQKVIFKDDTLTLTQEAKSYSLTPALRFMKTVAGDDVAGLVGKIRPVSRLKDMGAEHLSDSCIIGDTAYEVQEGFVAIVLQSQAVSDRIPPIARSAPAARPAAEPQVEKLVATPATEANGNDAELLTKFLLNNLNF